MFASSLSPAFFGLPGLLVGLFLGLAIRRWKFVFALAALGAIGTWFAWNYFGSWEDDENHPFAAIFAVASVLNFLGLLVGMVLGVIGGRALRASNP